MSSIYFQTQLPWSSSEQENKRFSKITYVSLIVAVVFAMVINWIQLPEQTREEKETLPPQLARILKPKPLPVLIDVVVRAPKHKLESLILDQGQPALNILWLLIVIQNHYELLSKIENCVLVDFVEPKSHFPRR